MGLSQTDEHSLINFTDRLANITGTAQSVRGSTSEQPRAKATAYCGCIKCKKKIRFFFLLIVHVEDAAQAVYKNKLQKLLRTSSEV